MSALVIYTLSNCDRCRKATKWLRAEGIEFSEKAIRDTPPTAGELRAMLACQHGDLRKLFNTSGRDYREKNLGERLPAMRVEDALTLLSTNGNLVKRPFLLGDGVGLVGFDEGAWKSALASK